MLRMLRPALRGLPVIMLVMAGMIGIVNFYLRYTTPMYESTAKIKLAETKLGVADQHLYRDFDVFATTTKLGAEVELLKSEALTEKALARLDVSTSIYRMGALHKTELYDQSPIRINATLTAQKWEDAMFRLSISAKEHLLELTAPSGETLRGRLNDTLRFPNGSSVSFSLNRELLRRKVSIPVNDRYEFAVHNRQNLIKTVAADLDVMSVDKEVPVMRISYKCAVPAKCADIVNGIADAYIMDYVQEKSKAADTTYNFLQRQLAEYSQRLTGSEASIQDYRDAHGIINLHQETETNLRKVADMKKQLTNVEMSLQAAEHLTGYMEAGKDHPENLAPNYEAFTDLLSTELVKKMKNLSADRRDLLTRLTPENEKVIALDHDIKDVANYLQEEVSNTAKDLRIKKRELASDIAEAESSFNGLPAKERNMTVLERNFGLNEQIVRFLQQKQTEAEIARAATTSFHRVISRGEVPRKPVSPNRKLLIVFGGFLGFIFGLLIVYGWQSIQARITDANTVYRNSDTPVAHSIPNLEKAAERKKFFRRWILEMELKELLPVSAQIAVSSMNIGEGKAFIATHLAEAAASIGKKVLLVSMDNRDLPTPNGVSLLHADDLPKRWGLPSQWKAICGGWQEKYDLIIIQNGAIHEEPASMTAMSEATLNLMVLDGFRTRHKDLVEADALKESAAIQGMEFVLNREGYSPSFITQVRRHFAHSASA